MKVLRHSVIGIGRFEKELSHLHIFIGNSTFEDTNSKLSQGLGHQPPSNIGPYIIRTIPKY